MEKASILLIEDSQSTRFLYKNILEAQGYHVLEAGSGEAGWNIIRKSPPDLVVLDLILPGMHGLEVLKLIRSTESTKEVPVLVLTNVKDADNAQKTMRSGANHYAYKKSVTDEEILNIVNELLEKNKPV